MPRAKKPAESTAPTPAEIAAAVMPAAFWPREPSKTEWRFVAPGMPTPAELAAIAAAVYAETRGSHEARAKQAVSIARQLLAEAAK